MIDAGRIDADHTNPASRNEPVGRRRIEAGKVQLGGCGTSCRTRSQVFLAIGPAAREASANQDYAVVEVRLVGSLPGLKIFNGDLVVAVNIALLRDIDARARPDHPFDRDLIDRLSALPKVNWRIDM